MGLSKAEILERVDEIADFTELGEFLKLPVRTYSMGMQARLTFAMATCLQPEIPLLDEGISAGDASFLGKANQRLQEFMQSTGILVFASHAEPVIKEFCNKIIMMAALFGWEMSSRAWRGTASWSNIQPRLRQQTPQSGRVFCIASVLHVSLTRGLSIAPFMSFCSIAYPVPSRGKWGSWHHRSYRSMMHLRGVLSKACGQRQGRRCRLCSTRPLRHRADEPRDDGRGKGGL